MATVEERIAALEMEIGRLRGAQSRSRIWGGALGAGLAALLLSSTAPAEARVVEATKFVLLDEAGTARATWGPGQEGEPELAFLSKEKEPRVTLGLAGGQGPGLRVSAGSIGSISVGCELLGQPSVVACDGKGVPRAALGTWINGSAGLSLFAPDRKERLRLVAAPDGAPFVSMFDGGQVERFGISVLERGSVGWTMWDAKGGLRLSAVVETDSRPAINLFGEREKLRAGLDVLKEGTAGLRLYDPSERLRWSAAVSKAGDAGVNSLDADGITRISLVARANGDANLSFGGGQAKPLAEFGAFRKDGKSASFLSLREPGERPRVELRASEGGEAMFRLADPAGNWRLSCAVAPTGQAGFAVVDAARRIQAMLQGGGPEFGEPEEGKPAGSVSVHDGKGALLRRLE